MVYSQVLILLVIDRFDTVGRLKFKLEYKKYIMAIVTNRL
jgi:hypothetical protein